MRYHTEEQYKENSLRLVDLLFEFHMLTDLDPHLHVQLKALEKEYGIDYGYENIREGYAKRKDEME